MIPCTNLQRHMWSGGDEKLNYGVTFTQTLPPVYQKGNLPSLCEAWQYCQSREIRYL